MPPKAQKQDNAKKEVKAKPAAAPATSSAQPSTKPSGSTVTKPDNTAYHAEQDALKKEIDELQAKLNAVKEKINLSKGGGSNERRDALRKELDEIRGQQGNNKASRQKIKEQAQTMDANLQNKIKALQAARGKTPYKTVDDVNAQITKLDNMVSSGTMKIVDERKTLQEISSLKRLRKTIETFKTEQDEIDKDRAELDKVWKQLDDPEMKAASDRYEQIQKELEGLKLESNTAYEGRSKLFDERTALQESIDALWKKKKEATETHRRDNDAYWKKVNEDRARRAEKAATERKAQEEAKRRQVAEEMLEQAKHPAFAAEIQDCQTLIDYFVRTSGGTATSSEASSLTAKKEVTGVPKLELRKVDEDVQGMVALKKKGEDENNYFVAKKAKKPSGKAPSQAPPAATATASEGSSASAQLQIPFGTLSGLLALSIPPPASAAEVPRVIEDLKTKKAWYLANQDRVTKENTAKAEAAIEKLNKAAASKQEQAPAEEAEASPVEASA